MSVPGARPTPRSMRPGAMDASKPNCSATTSGGKLGSIMPPAPRRIRFVSPTRRARSIAGAEVVTHRLDRKSEVVGKGEYVSVEPGGRRGIENKIEHIINSKQKE